MLQLGIRALVIATLAVGTSCFMNPVGRWSSSTSNSQLSFSRGGGLRSQRSTSSMPRLLPAHSGALGMKVELGPEETVEKYGLEAGLFKALKSGGKEGEDGKGTGATAQELLKRYGSAYLITSISFAAVSFGICYVAVSNGVDMAGLLSKVGIQAGASAETTGTFALAYAIHKAASPIRFPPTVALTPVVAKFLGKDAAEEEQEVTEE